MLLPFTMILGVIDSCVAIIGLAWDIALDLIWVTLTVIEYILHLAWLALVKWTPVLIKGAYNMTIIVVPAVNQMMLWSWQLLVATVGLFVSGCQCLIQLPWIDGLAATWNSTTSVSSLLQLFGDYTFKEISEIGLFEQLWGIISFALQFAGVMTIIVGIIVCMHILVWCLEGNRGASRSSVVMANHRNTLTPQRQPTAQPPSPNIVVRRRGQRSDQLTHRRQISQTSDGVNCSNRDRRVLNSTEEESSNSLISDTELLRRQLHQANEELSLERDKSLCVVCLDVNREVLLKPCNHYCVCSSCSNGLGECPLCMKRIQKTEKIFHA